MTPERWQQISVIFHSAIKLRPAERSEFLFKACGDDSSLREEVESLIAAHGKTGSFIDSPAYQKIAELLEHNTVELQAGQRIGSYEISSFLSRGGMGEVYLAQDRKLGRKVALKLLPSSLTKDLSRLKRFEQEARTASALNHPNIITIYEITEVDDKLIIATEFVEGETLRTRLSSGAQPINEALPIAIQIADALSAAHRVGIIHRDIKPENIMIRTDGYVKVLDFGLAKLAETGPEMSLADAPTKQVMTGSGVIIGTIGYMSPEQARGQDVDTRSDIFNLGAVIYEMVSGKKPFDGETTSDVFAAILKTEPAPLPHVAANVPSELVRIVTKALRKNRDERYQNVRDLLLDLRSLKEELDFQAKLDRSIAPHRETTEATASAQRTEAAETQELKSAVNTIAHSLNLKIRQHRAAAIVVTLALVALIAGAAALFRSLTRQAHPTESPQILSNRQITFSAGLDGFPAISPDGKSVAYSSNQNGNFEIFVKQLGRGGGELQLTNDGKQNFQPSWSPDGQRIAYRSRGGRGIWVISALGGTPIQLTDFGARPTWSFDGSQIAFQSHAGGEINSTSALAPSTIWAVSSSGGRPKQITQQGKPAGGHCSPAWSSDGKRIAFDSGDYLLRSVWTLDLQTGATKRIALGYNPVFGADGHSLYFMGEGGLIKIKLAANSDLIGESIKILSPGAGALIGNPSLSADARKIVYSATRILSTLRTLPVSPSTFEAIGPPSAFLPDTSQRTNLPRFSPDGSKIALNRWRPGSSADIWVCDADGQNLRQLTTNQAADFQANWFPDGERIAFLSNRDNKETSFSIWAVSLSTSREEKLLDLGEEAQFISLSPDGSQVALNYAENDAINIWLTSLKDGSRRQLTFSHDLMGFPSWSPDGRQISFEHQVGDDAFLMVMPSGGGQMTQLTSGPGKSWPHSWSTDGDKIVFAGERDGVWNIYWVSVSSKVQKQLTNYTTLNSFVRYPALSPQGNQIVYEHADITGNIWLLELK